MTTTAHHPWLHRFALLTAAATLALLGVGGLVTSHGAGMAVPDWPTSYGYNMFLFPLSKWWHAGNIFYEHSHRLFASGVGLLTTILAVWLWLKESRRWLKWLGVIAFVAVVLQGVLGGLRVVWFKDQIGIFHAALAQSFFALTCAIALFTSRWWRDAKLDAVARGVAPVLRRLALATTLLIFGQLVLGATMRHQHAGLAIPDFPLAYGKLWPALDADAIQHYNQQRMEVVAVNPITAAQIVLQLAHRLLAVAILGGVAACALLARRRLGASGPLAKVSLAWLGLVLLQAGLGAWTIWSDKAADVATAHVLGGALSLVTGVLWCLIAFRRPAPVPGTEPVLAPVGAPRSGSFETRPAYAGSQ